MSFATDYQNMLAMAQEMAKYGDFSGYQALGIDTSTMEQRYAQEQAAANAKRYSGGGTTPGSGKDKPSMSLSTAKLYANNGIWDDAVLDVFHKNGYTDALLTAEYGYKPGDSNPTSSRSPKFEAVVSQIQGMEDRTGGINQITTTVINANRQGLITDAEAKEILGWYGIRA